ncbi:hypothetical protein Agub_g3602, partial [Astrephomene gubernaculifera]
LMPPPLIVANPDVVTVDGSQLVPMPGSLAAVYGGAGGRVVLMGKPAALIYSAAGAALGLGPGELLAVGDSLEHDIAGAAAAGIDSLLIAGGIHAGELLPGSTHGSVDGSPPSGAQQGDAFAGDEVAVDMAAL